jgi:hypothetical protein
MWYECLGDSQVFQVSSRERNVGQDLNLSVTSLADRDVVAEVPGAAVDLDAVVKELLEGGDVEDLIVDRLRAVDDVLGKIVRPAQGWEMRNIQCIYVYTYLLHAAFQVC